jgi:hypothetical protein
VRAARDRSPGIGRRDRFADPFDPKIDKSRPKTALFRDDEIALERADRRAGSIVGSILDQKEYGGGAEP